MNCLAARAGPWGFETPGGGGSLESCALTHSFKVPGCPDLRAGWSKVRRGEGWGDREKREGDSGSERREERNLRVTVSWMSPEMLGREVGTGGQGRPTAGLLRPPPHPRPPRGSHPWQPAPSLVWPVTKRKGRKEDPLDPC